MSQSSRTPEEDDDRHRCQCSCGHGRIGGSRAIPGGSRSPRDMVRSLLDSRAMQLAGESPGPSEPSQLDEPTQCSSRQVGHGTARGGQDVSRTMYVAVSIALASSTAILAVRNTLCQYCPTSCCSYTWPHISLLTNVEWGSEIYSYNFTQSYTL